MGELTDKTSVAHLVQILYARGVRRVVLSPGSRNAPLSISFLGHGGFQVEVIGDERSAAFIALGMSLSDMLPTALVCTSGSAMLNYLPACAEAYYQRVPLIILTADRPEEWVDQMEGQTMRQRGAMSNFLVGEYHLPQAPESPSRLRFSERLVNEAVSKCVHPLPGPVHINIPLDEPLYGTKPSGQSPSIIEYSIPSPSLPRDVAQLMQEIGQHKRVMLLLGLDAKHTFDSQVLSQLAERGLVVLTETSSNVHGDRIISTIDRVIAGLPSDVEAYIPDLLITMGGPLVSKRIKNLFRTHDVQSHWHVDAVEADIDLFRSLTRAILCEPSIFLQEMNRSIALSDHTYAEAWSDLDTHVRSKHDTFLAEAPYSDLLVYEEVLGQIPNEAHIHMANSAAVRYVQLFDNREDLTYFGNRGVSGIEGSTSTAMGYSHEIDGQVILLSGDMAFRYDANAFWNKLEAPLKCIVVNNQGGGIFRIIPGPDTTDHLATAFEAHQENSAESVASMYGIPYMNAHTMDELRARLKEFFALSGMAILEVFTPREVNATVLRSYFDQLA